MATQSTFSNSAIIVVALLLVVSVIGIVAFGEERETDDRIQIIVSILPQVEFVEAVGGDHVRATVMVPPGEEPHTYEPTSSQMRSLENADIYFKVGSGIDFELAWMDRFEALNPGILIIDGSSNIALIPMTDSKGGAMDPHIWLSPANAKIMVQTLLDSLIMIDPLNASDYENNSRSYIEMLDRLDTTISTELSSFESRRFLVYHPAWGYFAARYDLEQMSIEVEGKEPTAHGLAKIIDQAKEYNINLVLISPEFSTRMAEQIADEIGGVVIQTDPLAKNYKENIEYIAEKLSEGLG